MKNKQTLIDTIYLDMDGVCADIWQLADILTTWIPFEGLSAPEQQQILTQHIRHNKTFYQQVQPYPYAKDLYDLCKRYAYDVCFLSGYPTKSDDELERVRKDKINWVHKYIDPNMPESDIIVVKGYKSDYATPHRLLIDDNLKNISHWKNQGGQGIYFKLSDKYQNLETNEKPEIYKQWYKSCVYQIKQLKFAKHSKSDDLRRMVTAQRVKMLPHNKHHR